MVNAGEKRSEKQNLVYAWYLCYTGTAVVRLDPEGVR